jgi:hypothetical protein
LATSQNITYNSCNQFFNVDVTNYLEYTSFDGCTADVIDPETCPNLAIIATNNNYEGGVPAFQAQVSLWMDLTCTCMAPTPSPTPLPPVTETVTMQRSMKCTDVGDCPVNFYFQGSSDDTDTVPFDASTCSVTAATLALESRAYRTKAPTITFTSGGIVTDLSQYAAVACNATVLMPMSSKDECTNAGGTGWNVCSQTGTTYCCGVCNGHESCGGLYSCACGYSCSGPADVTSECFESTTVPDGKLDVLPYLDPNPQNWGGTIASMTVHQGIYVDQDNCPDSELDATLTWEYQCPNPGAAQKKTTERVTYSLRGAEAMKHLSMSSL